MINSKHVCKSPWYTITIFWKTTWNKKLTVTNHSYSKRLNTLFNTMNFWATNVRWRFLITYSKPQDVPVKIWLQHNVSISFHARALKYLTSLYNYMYHPCFVPFIEDFPCYLRFEYGVNGFICLKRKNSPEIWFIKSITSRPWQFSYSKFR